MNEMADMIRFLSWFFGAALWFIALAAAVVVWFLWGRRWWRRWCLHRRWRNAFRETALQNLATRYPDAGAIPMGWLSRRLRELRDLEREFRIREHIAAMETALVQQVAVPVQLPVAPVLPTRPGIDPALLQELVDAVHAIQAIGPGVQIPDNLLDRFDAVLQTIRDLGIQALDRSLDRIDGISQVARAAAAGLDQAVLDQLVNLSEMIQDLAPQIR